MKFSCPTPKTHTHTHTHTHTQNKNNKLGPEIARGRCTYFEKYCYTFRKKHSSHISGWLLIKP